MCKGKAFFFIWRKLGPIFIGLSIRQFKKCENLSILNSVPNKPPFELYVVGTVNDVTGKDPEGQEHHCL